MVHVAGVACSPQDFRHHVHSEASVPLSPVQVRGAQACCPGETLSSCRFPTSPQPGEEGPRFRTKASLCSGTAAERRLLGVAGFLSSPGLTASLVSIWELPSRRAASFPNRSGKADVPESAPHDSCQEGFTARPSWDRTEPSPAAFHPRRRRTDGELNGLGTGPQARGGCIPEQLRPSAHTEERVRPCPREV